VLQPGTVLADRYRIDTPLGQEPDAYVYLAWDLGAQTQVLIKELRADLAGHEDFIEEVGREVSALRRLSHPFLICTRDLVCRGPAAYLVTDFVPGLSLAQRLREVAGPLTLNEITHVLHEVGAALDYLHLQGLAHLAVTPHNIILAGKGAMLAGPGLAAATERCGLPAATLADPAYLSPQQLLDEPTDGRSDIYSLGAVLDAMAADRPPFTADGSGKFADERSQALSRDSAPPTPRASSSALPEGAAEVILRALADAPDDRWPTVSHLMRAWDAALSRAAPRPEPAVRPDLPAEDPAVKSASVPSVPVAGPAELSRGVAALLWLLGIASVLGVAFALLTDKQSVNPRAMAAAALSGSPTDAANSPTVTTTAEPLPVVGMPATSPATVTVVMPTVAASAPAAVAQTPVPVTATPTPTPMPAGPYATIQTVTNVRTGPGTSYGIISTLQTGEQVALTGRNTPGDWWQVCCVAGHSGWIYGNLATAHGGLGSLPVIAVPVATGDIGPTPALSMTPVAAVSPTALPRGTPAAVQTTAAVPTATSALTATTRLPDAATPSNMPIPSGAATAASALACRTQPQGSFTALPGWRDQLGCPIGDPVQTDLAYETFQRGQLLYQHDLRAVYVLYADGTWAAYRDTYLDGQPFQVQPFDPPLGLKQPIKGFDRVWEIPEVRNKLGWATADEQSVIRGQVQAFQRGVAWRVDRPGYLSAFFVLLADGTWARR
jgi:uncharacterized protein YraI